MGTAIALRPGAGVSLDDADPAGQCAQRQADSGDMRISRRAAPEDLVVIDPACQTARHNLGYREWQRPTTDRQPYRTLPDSAGCRIGR